MLGSPGAQNAIFLFTCGAIQTRAKFVIFFCSTFSHELRNSRVLWGSFSYFELFFCTFSYFQIFDLRKWFFLRPGAHFLIFICFFFISSHAGTCRAQGWIYWCAKACQVQGRIHPYISIFYMYIYVYIYILFALRLLELLCFVCPVDLRNLKKYVIQRRKHTWRSMAMAMAMATNTYVHNCDRYKYVGVEQREI